jgi:vacuolar-type H+-ATPase subunit E/Vma4
MSQIRRKITLQLIPLLDLLLIVIFAQFMEIRQTAERLAQRTEAAEKASAEAKDQVATSIAAGQAELALQKRIGNLAAEIFRLPETFVKKALDAKTAEERAKLRKLLDNLPKGETADVVHQMATLSELRRLTDVWEIYLDDHDVARIKGPASSTRIEFDNQAEFERKFLDWYKTLPPTKNLVVIQFAYGDASAGPIYWIREGLTRSLERMRVIRNGQTLFESIDLGFRP